ncbi:Hypothetical_protein [Hexamita inflata]|uniref:Hypothetical_protein n=1 Tax=Hexamita inflata TaxID=28002 RepID=A0AA86NWN0_9EUKA|nr:Hypothetical protein HINF_LOCUS14105 [Hexamita inflata]
MLNQQQIYKQQQEADFERENEQNRIIYELQLQIDKIKPEIINVLDQHNQILEKLPYTVPDICRTTEDDIFNENTNFCMTTTRFDQMALRMLDMRPCLDELELDLLRSRCEDAYTELQHHVDRNIRLLADIRQNIMQIPEDIQDLMKKADKDFEQTSKQIVTLCMVDDNHTPECKDQEEINSLLKSSILRSAQNAAKDPITEQVIEEKDEPIQLDASAIIDAPIQIIIKSPSKEKQKLAREESENFEVVCEPRVVYADEGEKLVNSLDAHDEDLE